MFEYKINESGTWIGLPNNSSGPILVDEGHTVFFQWKLLNPITSVWKDGRAPDVPIRVTFNIPTKRGIDVPGNPHITSKQPRYIGDNGTFTVDDYIAPGAVLQYRISGSSEWIDIPKISIGPISIEHGKTISFKWRLLDPYNSIWKGK